MLIISKNNTATAGTKTSGVRDPNTRRVEHPPMPGLQNPYSRNGIGRRARTTVETKRIHDKVLM
jgi:hypothetical protein